MSELTLVGLRREQAELLTFLQDRAVLELEELSPENRAAKVEQASHAADLSAEQDLLQLCQRYERAIRSLEKRFSPERLTTALSFDRFRRQTADDSQALADLERFEALQQEEQKLKAEQNRLAEERRLLEPWLQQSLDLSLRELKAVKLWPGSLKEEAETEALSQQFREMDWPAEIRLLRRTSEAQLVLLMAHESVSDQVQQLLSASTFVPLPFADYQGTAAALDAADAAEEERLSVRESAIASELAELAAQRLNLMLAADACRSRVSLLEAKGKLDQSSYTFALRGWIATAKAAKLKRELEQHFAVALELREAEKGEDHPILLKNSRFAREFEILVEMFGLPQANESDPTPLLAPFSFLFYGMMLSDVGYGALLMILSLMMVRRSREGSEGSRMFRMFFLCGISSIFWGFVFGGFFGNMITVLTAGAHQFPCLWFDPLDNPMNLMVWSMIFGVVHLFFGMGLDMYNRWRRGETFSAIVDVLPWYFIVSGLGLMIGASSLPPLVGRIAPYMALGGAAVILLFGGREAKNPILRLLKGLLSLYDVTGYLSDILSYTRILALVLATSVIALVVNELGIMMGRTVIGYIFFALVAVLGHAINLALSALSAYVHTSRLQYVEFFGKFYQAGGRMFRPLKLEADYVRVTAEPEADEKSATASIHESTPKGV